MAERKVRHSGVYTFDLGFPGVGEDEVMAKTAYLLLCTFCAFMASPDGSAAVHSETERQLVSVMRWEILWGDSPKGFQIPKGGVATLAIGITPTTLAYCSNEFRTCAAYRTDPNRNWQRIATRIIGNLRTEDQALELFERALEVSASSETHWVQWRALVRVERREEIDEQYRRLKPPQFNELEAWLRETISPDSAYETTTIPCYAQTDPMTYLYVRRSTGQAVLVGVYWDRERAAWVEGGRLEPSPGPDKFRKMHEIVNSIVCETIRIKK